MRFDRFDKSAGAAARIRQRIRTGEQMAALATIDSVSGNLRAIGLLSVVHGAIMAGSIRKRTVPNVSLRPLRNLPEPFA